MLDVEFQLRAKGFDTPTHSPSQMISPSSWVPTVVPTKRSSNGTLLADGGSLGRSMESHFGYSSSYDFRDSDPNIGTI